MTTTLVHSPPAPLPNYYRPHLFPSSSSKRHILQRDEVDYDDREASNYSYASSSSSSSSMQNHPPLRPRISATSIPRTNPPIPPSLLDSPLIVNPNSPFRRDYGPAPSGPTYATGHDRLNLLDQVPMGSTSRGWSSYDDPSEPAPDDIGVAGTPKSARSSSINSRSTPLRPTLQRGNSWLQQQQADSRSPSSSSRPPQPQVSSPTQSTLKLPSTLPPNVNASSRGPPPTSSSSRGASGYISGAPTSSAGRSC